MRKSPSLSLTIQLTSLCIGLLLHGCGQKPVLPPPQPPEVTVARPVQKTVGMYEEFVGQMDSPQTVELRARVEGFLKEINFKEGAEVKKGDLMFTIDPAQYAVALQQSKAQLENAQAALQTAKNIKDIDVAKASVARDEATLVNAAQKLSDLEAAYKANAVSRESVDTAIATRKQAEAAVVSSKAILVQSETDYQTRVAQANAAVAAAEALVAQAQLNLDYTKIYSPLDGRVGLASSKIGALVGRGEPTLLATVSLTNPIYVSSSASERRVYAVRRARHERGITAAPTEEKLPVEMTLDDGRTVPQVGVLNFIDRALDPSTGTLNMRAEFANADHFLRPGNYAKIRIRFYEIPNAILINERAVGADQGGKYLLVVDDKNIVERRPVELGIKENGFVVVEKGLNLDERVIVAGLQRARPGKPVTPVPESAPPAHGSKPSDTPSKPADAKQ